jgi:hypothetical protein
MMDSGRMALLAAGERKLHFDHRVFWRCSKPQAKRCEKLHSAAKLSSASKFGCSSSEQFSAPRALPSYCTS